LAPWCFFPASAHADAFIPSLISANILWALALPVVVGLEGFLIERSGWQSPYKTSLIANLLSMAAALPLGVIITLAAAALGNIRADGIQAVVMGALVYGGVPVPSYGYLGRQEYASLLLAALVFMGLCWLATWAVEGWYFAKRNPNIRKREIYSRTAKINLASYTLLLALWLPYSLYSAYEGEEWVKDSCSSWNYWGSECPAVWSKYPDIRASRLQSCSSQGMDAQACLTREGWFNRGARR
jgi:hypothetical protein